MKKMFLILMMLLLITTHSASADVVTHPLSCAGTYDEYTSPWVHYFDLGVTFTEITQVSIQWSGTMDAAIVSLPGGEETWDALLTAVLTTDPDDYSTSVYARTEAGAATDPEPEPFDCESVFDLPYYKSWDELLDGQGRISIKYDWPVLVYGDYANHGEILLNNATLVVEGTVVPEPISLTMLLLGAATVLRKK
ncbi:MAG: hypothetical protein JW936_07140 [Sedimentisphaerales bacterium]|nr:hypothetical protein [Sedimentisphaerales bacterium]